ncbi:Zinc finger (C3HC4-type RING finger) family protein [Raphanus sativus]|uniref:E3 ubiquitin-protein ligase WAV3 n=1 Tax=Raphanus sativus TaxID=3726 RepID=A0A6J0KWP3_RAPSA|nr:E3 ubiquitin-protein ligase WAV3 [Raphanus sativus]KAJ4878985.1 Zinc finger (C3HC4-type RING finger) family protein [Raphanus sativus]
MENTNNSRDVESNQSRSSSVDATLADPSSPPPPRSTSSSSGLPFSKSKCAICLDEMRKEDGKAIFTAECSHSFHFDCITSNVKHGNRICPLCRTEWKQVPLFVNDPVPVPVSPFPVQTGFEDDESLPTHGGSESSGVVVAAHHRQALEIKLLPQVSAVERSVTRGDFAVLVHLKAEGASGDDDRTPRTTTRAPLDLITVLDVSGSMEGTKLQLLKNAVAFVIDNLGETDRLSVIAFSSNARRLFPLRLMTETGKREAIQSVNSLVAGGGTNIAEGLKIGARVIADRRWRNPVSGMMLLSDGRDNFTLSRSQMRLRTDYESLLPSSVNRIPIHTFGFGVDHDAELMHTISQVSSGTFSFIEAESVIRDAFAQCIGGLLSVVVLDQVVEIECLHEGGLKISSIKAGSYRSRVSSDGRSAKIDVGDMYAEEERDFLVILELPLCEEESMRLVKIRCVYRDAVSREIVRVESEELSIGRPEEVTGEEVVSVEVDRQLNRFLVSEAMSEARILADGGDLEGAVGVLRNRERVLAETQSARGGDGLVQSLSSELGALQERMSSRRMYERSGRAYAFSSMSSHSAQRATARGWPTCGSPAPQAYQTSSMARMVGRSQELGIKGTKPSPARRDRS